MENNISNTIPKFFFVLQLFNSLEGMNTKLTLQPGQIITIYLCGPTVYDHIHLGNLRPVIIFDVLHRLLLHLNVQVNYIQNITDIDDKIIAKAQKEGKSEKEISNHYTKSYLANLIRYNILFPNHLPRVTSYIPQIQSFIALLKKKWLGLPAGRRSVFPGGRKFSVWWTFGTKFSQIKRGNARNYPDE